MNQSIVTEPSRKDSLAKTFTRGVVGGIGWVVGMAIGWIVLVLLIIQFYHQFGFGPKLEEYIQNFVIQTTQKQLQSQQNIIQNLMPPSFPANSKPVDLYPENISDLLRQNKN